MTPLELLLSKLPGARQAGRGWMAKCPAHDDRKASLSISQAGDGTVLVKCHAGCDTLAVLRAVGMELRDLFPRQAAPTPNRNGKAAANGRTFATAHDAVAELERQHGKRSAQWAYRNAQGEAVGVVVRWDKPNGKDVRPVAKCADGWRIGAMPEPRPLYRLPEVRRAARVLVTEGEKCADAAWSLGLVATTSAGGSQAAHKSDWTPLAGKEVWILPDNDTPGRKYAETVADILAKLTPAATVRIVELPGLPHGGDLVDWIAAHGDAAEPNAMRAEIEALAQAAGPVAGELLVPVSLDDLVVRYPTLRPPVIHGLLRQGETMNIIAPPKTGKSWLVTDLALAVATGRPWLDTFETDPGNVLIIDNELHAETSANRIPRVAAARQIGLGDVGQRVFVQNLRGHWQDIFSLGPYFRSLEPGRFHVIILDAMYRFMPREMDENDNGTMANVYNAIDRYADLLGCCFVIIHHTTKGNQSGKAVTDVGAGAGSQSRATDTHLVLRPHEEEDVVVLEAAVRSWPPVMPRCLRWAFPVWQPADDLDPTLLRTEQPRRSRRDEAEPEWTVERFVATFIDTEPRLVDALLVEANRQGINDYQCRTLLRKAEAVGLVHRWDMGYRRLGYATQAPPVERQCTDDDALAASRRPEVEDLLRTSPELPSAAIAARCGVSKRYVNRIRRELAADSAGTQAGTGGNCGGNSGGNSSGNRWEQGGNNRDQGGNQFPLVPTLVPISKPQTLRDLGASGNTGTR